ncbi:MAG: PQQ-dependent sugar dehydrogenase [Pyrinomonadaceae bacterium]
MRARPKQLSFTKKRLIVLPALFAGLLGFLLTQEKVTPSAEAFSAGPPAGYTGAPGEVAEACAECHVPPDAGTGHISINAPLTYTPGQTYSITVTHANPDLTRRRWGFELTVLDGSDEKAGELDNVDGLTQVLDNAGPGNARQYIEHTSAGTFVGQQNGATWTFNWTAPSTDVGPITFYAAGNQANNDGNTSGDYIYRTFVASVPASTTLDFALNVIPASRNVVSGGSAQYSLTLTPFAGFTGTVNLNATGLPAGVSADFVPTSVTLSDANSTTATLTLTSTAGTPLGAHSINVNGQSGSITHTAPVTMNVVSPASADLMVTKTASPNPGQVSAPLTYRITATNNGPATATNVTVTDTLPSGVNFGSVVTTQGSCNGAGPVTCSVGSMTAGSTAIITINVTPTATGQVVNSAAIGGTETDFDPSNNSASITTFIQGAAVTPSMTDPNLTVSTVITGLNQPTSMVFIGTNDFFVLERTTGRVLRIVNGAIQSTVLDLPVNGFSERGLLGIALHPNFTQNGFVYLYWTESSTGADSGNVDDIAILGNRVDRYVWNGSSLTFDKNLIRLRALQSDAGQSARGNHNGGVLRFGIDEKLYIIFGDNGRRGFLQNLPSGGPVPDDQFGGPEPDDAHMTGVILRLNDDGSTPIDNPFFNATTSLTGAAAANIKKVFAYGIRNSFGMAVDPLTGSLWTQENGDDAFDEINHVVPGFNGGWIQVMGPLSRVNEFRSIESTYGAGNLQQLRWPPTNIAPTPQQALARMFMVPGAEYIDPEFSWRYAVAPSPIGFVQGRGLGPQYEGDLLVGASRTTLLNGYLFRFRFNSDRQHFSFADPRLTDRVADNVDKFDQTESETLVIGQDFGITTDIQTAPNGNVFVVSLSNGAVYEIKPKPSLLFVASLDGSHEVPSNNSIATGSATLLLAPDEKTARVSLNFSDLSSSQTAAHIHGPAPAGVSAPVLFPLPAGQVNDFEITLLPGQAADLKNGLWYINVHSSNFTNGEIRGQFASSASASTIQFQATKYVANEGQGNISITVNRIGNTSAQASVTFTTTDTAGTNNCNVVNGAASGRCDYLTTIGSIVFAAGETSKNIAIPITDDGYAEGNESFALTLTGSNGANIGSPNSSTVTIIDNDGATGPVNPIDDAAFFVRQHYLDFLNREPDQGGFDFWTNEITQCAANAECTELKRINVSAAFFLSIEFQQTGYLVYRMYKAAYGNISGSPVPLTINESLPDTQQISQGLVVGAAGWEQRLETNKQLFATTFVSRSRFTVAYPMSLSPAQFIDALYANTGVVPTTEERNAAVDEFAGAGNTGDDQARARALRRVVDNTSFTQLEFSRAFVLMEYFGYLRRNPNSAPDGDFSGYNFWLTKLDQFGGNFVNAEMVKAFIASAEYRRRFGLQ